MGVLNALLRCALVGLAAADDSGDCKHGHTKLDGECVGDPCNVEESIRAPRHGSLGTCGKREFEFVHLRPNPIDESDISVKSLAGALGTIGIPFKYWDRETNFSDGAVFWTNPDKGPSGNEKQGVQVAQLTVRTGTTFRARLNFQGRTKTGCENDDTQNDGDSGDSCQSSDWQEKGVDFTNDLAAMKENHRAYRWLIPSLAIVAGGPHQTVKGITGYTTYKLIVHLRLNLDARNVYAIYGDTEHPAILPAVYQVKEPGFGADIGGTHHSLWSLMPESQFDSYLTIGAINMDHPDVLDNLHMLADGERCSLACNKGYTLAGDQPLCKAGVVIESIQCKCTGNDCSNNNLDPNDGGDPNDGDGLDTVGNDGPTDGKTSQAGKNHILQSAAHGSGATQSDGGGTESSTPLLFAGVGVAVVVGVLAAGLFARKGLGRKQVMPTDANAAANVFEAAGSVSGASERNTADNADNAMFGGFTIEAS